jgi:hypothetical protein
VVLLAGLAFVTVPPVRHLVSDSTPPAQDDSGTPSAGVRSAGAVADLLRRRARAVLSRDEASFMATVDPKADPAFRAAQRALFGNVGTVPLRVWEYLLDPNDAMNLTPPPEVPGADELWAPRVDLRYALAGVDVVPTSRPMGYLFDRRGREWFLASDTALDSFGRETWRGPWDFGPCRVIALRSGMVLAHPGHDALAHRVAAELDAAVADVAEVWGTGWSQRVAVVLPQSELEMQAMVGPEFSVSAIAAVAIADRIDQRTHAAEGQRVVLNQDTADRLSESALRVVLRHETTHVAARGVTVDGAPMWLLEGFADYVGYRRSGIPFDQAAADLVELVRTGGPPDELPSDADFHAGAAQLDLAYQEAWTATLYLAGRIGEPRLVQLYRRVASLAHPTWPQVDDALRAVAGVDHIQLTNGWREFLRRHLVDNTGSGHR